MPRYEMFRIDILSGERLLVHTVIHLFINSETIAPEILSLSRSSVYYGIPYMKLKLMPSFVECTIGSYPIFIFVLKYSIYINCMQVRVYVGMAPNLEQIRFN